MTAANPNAGALISEIELNEYINCRPGVAVTALSIDRKAVTLPADGKATLNASIAPAETFDREVDWASSAPAIAEVRRIGEQIAIVVGKRPGRCVVTARIGKVKQVCLVTVTTSSLPAGWNYKELNQPVIPGSALFSNGRSPFRDAVMP